MSLIELTTDLKTAWATAWSTAGTGAATIVEWIPDGIGKLGTLVGIVLSIVLIYVHVGMGAANRKKAMLDIAKAELEIKELKRKARRNGRGGV